MKSYPKPPFKPQQQSVPGEQSRMEPYPDCGESSYKGSGRLANKIALITGGDSGIGRVVKGRSRPKAAFRGRQLTPRDSLAPL
jgi:hypothetical protein